MRQRVHSKRGNVFSIAEATMLAFFQTVHVDCRLRFLGADTYCAKGETQSENMRHR